MAQSAISGVTHFSTPSDIETRFVRLIEAPRERVWAAWTNPRHLPHWMLGPEGWTMPVCEIDLQPGGAQRCVWRRDDGTEMEINSIFNEIDRRAAWSPPNHGAPTGPKLSTQ